MKYALTLVLALLLLSPGFANSPETESDNLFEMSREMGLVAYLTYIKTAAESKIYAENSKSSTFDPSGRMKKNYNLLKVTIDLVINQATADMTQKNSIKLYKRLNKYVKEEKDKRCLNKKLGIYKSMMDDVEMRYKALMRDTLIRKGVGISDISLLGIAEFAYGIVTDARDARQTKVASLVKQLEALKPVPLNVFLKKEDE